MSDQRTTRRTAQHTLKRDAARRKKTAVPGQTSAVKFHGLRPIRERSPGARGGLILREEDFRALYCLPALERIEIIKGGVHASFVPSLAHAMGTSKEALLTHLGLPRATVDRKIRENRKLSQDESQRVVGMAKLIGLVENMVQDAVDFDAAVWLAKWVDAPLPALGGRKPAEFLDTAEGQELISNTLQRMQSGAYS